MLMRLQTIASNVSICTISPTATPLPKAYDCVGVYIAGRRTNLVVYGWRPKPPTKKVVNHTKGNNLFSKDQHDFMNGRSTVTQLLETLEYWPRHLDSGLAIEAIYLDFQKAFDSVRQRLLKKLRSYGVREQVYSENANKKLL